jgi:hypothetical protein
MRPAFAPFAHPCAPRLALRGQSEAQQSADKLRAFPQNSVASRARLIRLQLRPSVALGGSS